MQIELQVPIIFYGTPLNNKIEKRLAAFIPMNFEIEDVSISDAPLVAKYYQSKNIDEFIRQHGENIYSGSIRHLKSGNLKGKSVQVLIQQLLFRQFCEKYYSVDLSKISHSCFGKLWDQERRMFASRISEEALSEYFDSGNTIPFDEEKYAVESDFQQHKEAMFEVVAKEAERYVQIDGVAYEKCFGPVWKVAYHYNGKTKISTEIIKDIDTWIPSHDSAQAVEGRRSFYFGINEREAAENLANKLRDTYNPDYEIERETSRCSILIDEKDLSQQDIAFAEFYRSAKMFSIEVGREIFRRIKLNPLSIYTEDPKYRYAFDRLNDALNRSNPFGGYDVELENSAVELRDLLLENKEDVDEKYYKLVSSKQAIFDHVEISLNRLQDNTISITNIPVCGPK